MKVQANSIEEYLAAIPAERKPYMEQLHRTILDNLPEGFAKLARSSRSH